MTTTSPPMLIPLEQAAAEMKTTPLHVLMHLKRGLLRGVESAEGWQIEAETLATLLRQRQECTPQVFDRKSCPQAGSCGSTCC